jgi:hypothetical protein
MEIEQKQDADTRLELLAFAIENWLGCCGS